MYVLASASPRRRELLQLVLPEFAVCPADCDESCTISDPEQLVMELSRRKCRASRALCAADDVVIAADTLVFLEDAPLGKPRSEAEARAMLARLSGRTHRVLTAYTLWGNGQEVTRCISTDVVFFPLTAAQIAAYVATGEPMDKAGSYGIQGGAALFAEKMAGDYYNVMGLPVCRLGNLLRQIVPELLEETL